MDNLNGKSGLVYHYYCVKNFFKQRLKKNTPPAGPVCNVANLDRYWCMREEVEEYRLAVQKGNKAEILDALVDLHYFMIGTMLEHGISLYVFNKAFDRVHECNMKKEFGQKFDRVLENQDVVGSGPDLKDLVNAKY